MPDIYDHARALVKALRESDASRQMRRLGAKVKSDARLEALLTEFRQRKFESQASQLQGKALSEGQTERLQKLAKDVEGESLLREYLTAETAYGQLLVEVQQVLAEAYNPEVPGQIRQTAGR